MAKANGTTPAKTAPTDRPVTRLTVSVGPTIVAEHTGLNVEDRSDATAHRFYLTPNTPIKWKWTPDSIFGVTYKSIKSTAPVADQYNVNWTAPIPTTPQIKIGFGPDKSQMPAWFRKPVATNVSFRLVHRILPFPNFDVVQILWNNSPERTVDETWKNPIVASTTGSGCSRGGSYSVSSTQYEMDTPSALVKFDWDRTTGLATLHSILYVTPYAANETRPTIVEKVPNFNRWEAGYNSNPLMLWSESLQECRDRDELIKDSMSNASNSDIKTHASELGPDRLGGAHVTLEHMAMSVQSPKPLKVTTSNGIVVKTATKQHHIALTWSACKTQNFDRWIRARALPVGSEGPALSFLTADEVKSHVIPETVAQWQFAWQPARVYGQVLAHLKVDKPDKRKVAGVGFTSAPAWLYERVAGPTLAFQLGKEVFDDGPYYELMGKRYPQVGQHWVSNRHFLMHGRGQSYLRFYLEDDGQTCTIYDVAIMTDDHFKRWTSWNNSEKTWDLLDETGNLVENKLYCESSIIDISGHF